MSKHESSSEMLLRIDDYKPSTEVITQHGMIYPDGTVRWGQDVKATLNPVVFRHLHEGNAKAVRLWEEALVRKASDASLDLEDYRGQFTPVKRTVIVAVTNTEEV